MPCCSFLPTCGSGSGVTGPIRCVMCRLLRGPVEAFFAGRDLAAGTCRTYRQALGPLVEFLGADRPVTALHADRVAAVFAELWADRAPATWNTRRVAVQAFASWCGDRWPLASDLLAGVGPRRRRADNTRAVLYEDLDDLWLRRDVPLSLNPPMGSAQRTWRYGGNAS